MRLLRLWLRDIINNWDSFLMAFFLALIVWVIAVEQEDPIIVADVPTPIPVRYLHLNSDLTILGDPVDSVRLRVRAQRSIVQALDASAFQAYVDLAGKGPGVHTIPIQVEGPREVKILSVQPPKAVIHIERLAAKAVAVRVEIMDYPPLGYMVRQDGITVEPMTVTVKGPESEVNKVVVAVAEVYVQGERSTIQNTVALSPRDKENLPVFDCTIDPPVAHVVVPIEPQPGFAEVPVVPRTIGRPADGYRVSSISVDPPTVTLRGNPQALQKLPGYIETEPLDISGATQDIVERLPLRVPENVSILGSKTAVVTVRIVPLEGGKTVVRPLKVQGMPEGVVVNVPIRSVQIILAGPLPKLNNLGPDDVQAVLDLSTINGEGVFTLKPQILTPSDIRVEAVIPEEIQIEVRAPTPTPTPTPSGTETPSTLTPIPHIYQPTPTATP